MTGLHPSPTAPGAVRARSGPRGASPRGASAGEAVYPLSAPVDAWRSAALYRLSLRSLTGGGGAGAVGGLSSLDSYRTTDRAPSEPVRADSCPTPITLRQVVISHREADPVTDQWAEGAPAWTGAALESVGTWERTLREVEKPCGCWSCRVCGPAKQRMYVAHFVALFKTLTDLRFVTLTLDPKTGIRPEDSRAYLVHCFSKWRKRVNRRVTFRERLRYACTVEPHKSGLMHLHGVISAPGVSDDELAAEWFEAGGGVVCDVQPITAGDGGDDVARFVGYAVKYALKDAQAAPVPNRRYVLASQGDGFHSARSKAARGAFVADRRGGGEAAPATGEGEAVVWVASTHGRSHGNPDAITPEQRARFAALDLGGRTREYRWKDGSGRWHRVEQSAGGRRRSVALDGYRSLWEERTGGARRAPP